MNRTLLSLIVGGMFTSFVGPASAQNVTAGEKPLTSAPANGTPADPTSKAPKVAADPKQSTSTRGEPGGKGQAGPAASKQSREKTTQPSAKAPGQAEYNAAKDKATADYKEAKVKCDAQQGEAMRSCMADAKAARTQALTEAKAQWQDGKRDSDAAGGDMKKPTDESKADTQPGSGTGQQDSDGGGRFEKSRDDSILPDADRFQNVSTARKSIDSTQKFRAIVT